MQLKYKSDYITLKLNVINGKNKWHKIEKINKIENLILTAI